MEKDNKLLNKKKENLSFYIKKRKDIIEIKLKNELLVFDYKRNKIYSLNKYAISIWNLFNDRKISFEKIIHKLKKKMKERDVIDFVNKLKKMKLIKIMYK